MSKHQKALEKMRQNPKNVRYDELERLLLNLGFIIRRGTGSHVVFTLRGHPPLTVPKRKPFLSETYIKQVLIFLDGLGLSDDEH